MESFVLILELIGTFAFAVSGAILAIKKEFDLFGVLVCGVITAFGGGLIRDLLIGRFPPAMFQNYQYLAVAAASSLVMFVALSLLHNVSIHKRLMNFLDILLNLFDAVGLGLYSVIGINTALSAGYRDNAFFVIFLGVMTGCGGGILRDTLMREVPMVFSKRIYAVASIVGGVVYYEMFVRFSLGAPLCLITGVLVTVLLRVLARRFRWNLPKAYKTEKILAAEKEKDENQ